MKTNRSTANPPLLPPARRCESSAALPSRKKAFAPAGGRNLRLLAGLIFPSLLAFDASAIEATWLGGNFLWDNNANWSGGAYPGATSGTTNADKAVFGNSVSGNVFLPAHINVKDLEFLADSKIGEIRNGTLVFTEGGSITRASGASYLNIWSNMVLSGTGISVTNAAGFGLIGNISGTGGLTFQGSGGLQLDGQNTYTGKTIFNNTSHVYILRMANGGAASSIGASSKAAENLLLGSGMTFRYYGAAASTDRSFTHGGGNISFFFGGSGALKFTDSAAIAFATPNVASAINFSGNNAGDNQINLSIGDNGTATTSIAKYETSKVILSGSNSYSGITTVYQGILNIQNDHALGSTTGITRISDGVHLPAATLQIQGGISIGNETLELANMGFGTQTGAVVNVSGDNTWGGKIILTHNARISSDSGSLAFNSTDAITGDNRNLTLNGAGDGSIAAALATTGGSLTKTGAGTWRLSGASTFSGGTTVSAGTLLINNTSGSGTGSGSVQVAADAILGGNGTIAPGTGRSLAVSGIVAAGDAKVNDGIGTFTINGASTTQPVAVFASTASFRFDLNGTSATGDMIRLLNGAAGDFVFNSNQIEFSITGILANDQTYLLFAGTASNQFAGLTLDAENRITGGLTFTPLGEGYENSYLSLVDGEVRLHIVAVPEGSTLAFLSLGAMGALAARGFRRRVS